MTGKQMIKLFKRHGWQLIRTKGSHYTFRKGSLMEQVPCHTTELNRGLEIKLLKKLQEGES